MSWIFTSFKQVYHSVVRQLYRESAWMIVGDRLLRSVLVLLSIYVFLFSVFSNIAPVWTNKVVADQPCMTMYTGQFLRQLQGASNCCLNNTAWRAACTAGVALRRPTHRGCRGVSANSNSLT